MKKMCKLGIKPVAWAAVVSGALLLSPADVSAQTSPVGLPWDCLISGSLGPGVGYLTFNSDFTLSGIQITRAVKTVTPVVTSDPDSRNSGDADERGGDDSDRTSSGSTTTSGTTSNTGSTTNVVAYGFSTCSGVWSFDPYGKVAGTISLATGLGTNLANIKVTTLPFKAIVSTNSRLTMAIYTPNGSKALYSGITMRDTLPDLSGDWYGVQRTALTKIPELFELAPSYQLNAYTVAATNTGSSYSIEGWVILSARGRIGTAFLNGGLERTTIGTYSRTTGLVLTTGFIEPLLPVVFNAKMLAAPIN